MSSSMSRVWRRWEILISTTAPHLDSTSSRRSDRSRFPLNNFRYRRSTITRGVLGIPNVISVYDGWTQPLRGNPEARLKPHHDDFPFLFAIAGEYRRNEDDEPEDA
jgi:hypothetical protein